MLDILHTHIRRSVTERARPTNVGLPTAGVSSRARRWPTRDIWLVPVTLTVFVVVWQAAIWIVDYPPFILPAPVDVVQAGHSVLSDGTLWRHTQATLTEVLSGLGLGLLAASLIGYPLAKSRRLERLVAPYLVASQSVPVVAIAPLLVIWFGSGRLSKVLVCALIVFFPMLVNVMLGLRSVPAELRDLMRSLQASHWQTLWLLEIPAALPLVLGGLRVGVTLAVVGAVVGELVGADQGLGFMINQARGLFNTPLVFVAILTLVTITMTLYGVVLALEKRLLRWRA